MKKVILTVIGPDKPGIIASVSDILFTNSCNIENISQTILQSEFAGICIVSIPDDLTLESLQETLMIALGSMDLHIHSKILSDETPLPLKPETEPFIISTCGPDRKGLVALISKIIAGYGVNISNLKAVFEGGANPDRNIMIFEVDIPNDIDLPAFSNTLKQQAGELNLDLTVQHKNIFDVVNRI